MPEFRVGQRVEFTVLIAKGRPVGFGDAPVFTNGVVKCRECGVLVEVGELVAVVAPDVPNARGYFYRVALSDLKLT